MRNRVKVVPLLCLNMLSGICSRFVRSKYGKVVMTHYAELGPIHEGSQDQLNEFLLTPPDSLAVT